jgi:hypothetical protein
VRPRGVGQPDLGSAAGLGRQLGRGAAHQGGDLVGDVAQAGDRVGDHATYLNTDGINFAAREREMPRSCVQCGLPPTEQQVRPDP